MYNFKELQSNDTHYTYKLKTYDQKLKLTTDLH